MIDGAPLTPHPGLVQVRHEAGKTVLVRRKFGRVGTAFLRLLRVAPDLTIRLDSLGSQVWQLIDGKRNSQEILAQLQAALPDETDLPERLGRYLSMLASNRLIVLR